MRVLTDRVAGAHPNLGFALVVGNVAPGYEAGWLGAALVRR